MGAKETDFRKSKSKAKKPAARASKTVHNHIDNSMDKLWATPPERAKLAQTAWILAQTPALTEAPGRPDYITGHRKPPNIYVTLS